MFQRSSEQCGGSGSVESVSFPWIRIRIKNLLDPESESGSATLAVNTGYSFFFKIKRE